MDCSLYLLQKMATEAIATPYTGDPKLDAWHKEIDILVGHPTPYYKFFWMIAQRFKPRFVVELGSWRAYGAAHFAGGCPSSQVVTIDIHKDDAWSHQRAIDVAASYDNLTFLHGWTWDMAPTVAAMGKQIDVLYIDAWHTYENVKREWDLYTPLLASRALILMDDLFNAPGACEGMIEFWAEFVKNKYPNFIDAGLHLGIPFGVLEWTR